ncbi:MAG: DUF433 domain-containing protein [Calditrichaeota bacterium]|nr:DUF433 domain-containing protein [Calditrichota bacterium]
MNQRTNYFSYSKICSGFSYLKRISIPVHIILSHLAAGDGFDIILENFPGITIEDIKACLEYASYLATEKEISIS